MSALRIRFLRPLLVLTWLGAAISTSCAPEARAPLDCLALQPDPGDAMFLNEELVLFFNDELEPSSALGGGVRLLDREGEALDVELSVERQRLRLRPSYPIGPALDDGTLRPGEEYRLQLLGFPHPNALRARDGRPLRGSLEWSLRVADPERGEQLFTDPNLGPFELLVLERDRLGEDEELALVSSEPLDPRSFPEGPSGLELQAPGVSGGPPVRLPLRGVLTRNDVDGARIELWPLSPAGDGLPVSLEPRSYFLAHSDPSRPTLPWTDLGGQPARLLGTPANFPIEVTSRTRGPERRSLAFEFSGDEELTPELPARVPQAWSAAGPVDGSGARLNGHLGLRFPKAAGAGIDGDVRLEGSNAALSERIEAWRLTLAPGARAEFGERGLVLWRAQGRLQLSGELVRRVQVPDLRPRPEEPEDAWISRLTLADPARLAPAPEFTPGASLTSFLAQAEADDPPWTVLIAGGDLWIDGDLDLDGPLLIVAGGRVRVTGRVRASEIWSNEPMPGVVPARSLPLWLDPPQYNPLAGPVIYAVSSSWLPAPPEGGRWSGARAAAHFGHGRVRVEYIGQSGRGSQVAEFGPVDDPRFLADYERLRFTVWFELSAAGPRREPWDPPYLDRLDLLWQSRTSGR